MIINNRCDRCDMCEICKILEIVLNNYDIINKYDHKFIRNNS